MNKNIENLLDKIEDIAQKINSSDYKYILDNLMELHKNSNDNKEDNSNDGYISGVYYGNEVKQQENKQENKFIVGNFYALKIPYGDVNNAEYYKIRKVKCVKQTSTFIWFKYSSNNLVPLLKYRKNTDCYNLMDNQDINGVKLTKRRTKIDKQFLYKVEIYFK